MRRSVRLMLSLAAVVVICCGAADNGCSNSEPSSVEMERQAQNIQMDQFLRNQPVPSFDWSLERHMMIQLYAARQRATNTYSVVQSEFTGKILWSCPSIGFPIPYSTQLTNPLQAIGDSYHALTSVGQQEPNGLFSPTQSDATWVPCVDEHGDITPVYEEKRVTVFLRPVEDRDGQLVPIAGKNPSLTITPHR